MVRDPEICHLEISSLSELFGYLFGPEAFEAGDVGLTSTVMSEGLVSVELAALTSFTANDAIMNGLHISSANVPAELASLLAIVCRARRPSSPAVSSFSSFKIRFAYEW